MKIVILSDGFTPYSSDGAEVIASNLSSGLSERGHKVYVITTVKDKKNVGMFEENGIKIYRLYSDYDPRFRAYKCINNRKVVSGVEKILREINPDVVHAHNIHAHLSYASLKVSKKYSKSVVLTFHDVMSVHYGKLGARLGLDNKIVLDSIRPLKQLSQYKFRYNPFRNIFIKFYLKYVDLMFSVSYALKKVLESKGIAPIEVIHNGIDVSKWEIEENILIDFKEKYNLDSKKVLFFGGRLSSAKGGMIASEVLNEVLKKINNVVLFVVGESNSFSESLIKKAKGLGIEDKIIMAGKIDHSQMKYAYASSDVVLVLSQYVDPFPTVNLEAMASKKPVVGTVLGGTPEVVLDNQTGYIVNPQNVSEISHKVFDLLSDPGKVRQFGQRGYNRVLNEFSEKDYIDKTISYYDKILGN